MCFRNWWHFNTKATNYAESYVNDCGRGVVLCRLPSLICTERLYFLDNVCLRDLGDLRTVCQKHELLDSAAVSHLVRQDIKYVSLLSWWSTKRLHTVEESAPQWAGQVSRTLNPRLPKKLFYGIWRKVCASSIEKQHFKDKHTAKASLKYLEIELSK